MHFQGILKINFHPVKYLRGSCFFVCNFSKVSLLKNFLKITFHDNLIPSVETCLHKGKFIIFLVYIAFQGILKINFHPVNYLRWSCFFVCTFPKVSLIKNFFKFNVHDTRILSVETCLHKGKSMIFLIFIAFSRYFEDKFSSC